MFFQYFNKQPISNFYKNMYPNKQIIGMSDFVSGWIFGVFKDVNTPVFSLPFPTGVLITPYNILMFKGF